MTYDEMDAYNDAINKTIEAINRTPTADVTEVIHGRWIAYPDCGVTRCSVCDWSIEEAWHSDYCPNCGAKMTSDDGKEREQK